MSSRTKPAEGSELFELLRHVVVGQCSFMAEAELEELARLWPECVVLVRCGGGRFLISADMAAGSTGLLAVLARCSEAEGDSFSWYVRDVSFPADSLPVLWFGSSLSTTERG